MATAFGLQPLTEDHLHRLSFLPAHIRDILEYHRDFDTVDFAAGRYYIYTGRGPSKASFHIGHLPALQLCLALQKQLGTKIQFMIADDEKMFRDGLSAAEMAENVSATLSQLERIGFTDANTQFRINSAGLSAAEYAVVIQMLGSISVHTLESIFGAKANLGEYFYPLLQILPCMSRDARCIVVAGADQDPFFRLARDIARKLGYPPPVVLYTRSVPGLDGSDKMSTSAPQTLPVYLSDTPQDIARKVKKIGQVGAGSLEELFLRGADLAKDVPYQLLRFFDRSDNLPLLAAAYTAGVRDADAVRLRDVVGAKGVYERDGRVMLTSAGIRTYLTQVLQATVAPPPAAAAGGGH